LSSFNLFKGEKRRGEVNREVLKNVTLRMDTDVGGHDYHNFFESIESSNSQRK